MLNRLTLGFVALAVVGLPSVLQLFRLLQRNTVSYSPPAAGSNTSCTWGNIPCSNNTHEIQEAVALYPNLLTARPTVDCEAGRYLHVASWASSGMTHMHEVFNGVLMIAMALNMTLVYSPRRTVGSHGGTDNDSYMYTRVFSVTLDDIAKCDEGSAVRRYTLNMGEAAETWGGRDLLQFELTVPQANELWEVLHYKGIPNNASGFFLKFRSATACAPYFASTGKIFRAMYSVGRGIARVDEVEDAVAAVFEKVVNMTRVSAPYVIGVHVRRGDIMSAPQYESWRLPASYFEQLTMAVVRALPSCLRQRAIIVVYTEGDCCEFEGLFQRARDAGCVGGFAVVDGHPAVSLLALAASDVIVTSFSGFSTVAAHYSTTAFVLATIAAPYSYTGVVNGALDVARTQDKRPVYDAFRLTDMLREAHCA